LILAHFLFSTYFSNPLYLDTLITSSFHNSKPIKLNYSMAHFCGIPINANVCTTSKGKPTTLSPANPQAQSVVKGAVQKKMRQSSTSHIFN